jgi:hypothetical protein
VVTGQRSDANDELCRAGGVDLPPLGSSALSLSLSPAHLITAIINGREIAQAEAQLIIAAMSDLLQPL